MGLQLMKMIRSQLIRVPVLLLLLFMLTSCGFWLLPLRREKTMTFAVNGAEFSRTFDICVRAAKEIEFEINELKKHTGQFEADRGYGFDEISVLRFHLQEGYKRKLYFTIRVKSSKGSEAVIMSFVDAINKDLKTYPIESYLDLEK